MDMTSGNIVKIMDARKIFLNGHLYKAGIGYIYDSKTTLHDAEMLILTMPAVQYQSDGPKNTGKINC